MDKNVTINDIAKAAGVGKGTVDRVLHNRGRVSEGTKKRVLKCIQELNYKPNAAARMLAKRNIYKIAVVYHNKEREFWKQIEDGIAQAEDEYHQMGIVIDRYVLPHIDIEKQYHLIKKVIDLKYDGLAIVPYASEKILRALDEAVDKGIPVVTFNNDEKCKRACYVGQNLLQSGRTAGKLMSMIAKPNSKYAVILPVTDSMSALHKRYEGFMEIIEHQRKDMTLVGVYNCEQDGKQAYKNTSCLLKKEAIDAIYASNVIVEDVARAVFDMGFQNKIKVIGHDLTDTIKKYIKNGTIDISIGQEPQKQGYIAIEKLCRYLLLDEKINEDVYTKIEVAVKENLVYT